MTAIRFGIARRIGAFVAAVLLLLTVALATAAADDPETITTRLEPGLNFVGWVGPEIPVFELFADVPEIHVVHAWHAGQRAWQSASPRVPPSLHTLHWLRPGMGLVLEIEGEDPVEWTRPFGAAGAPLWISAGVNLIAWTGPDGYASNGLEDRFGASLLNIWAWDQKTERYSSHTPRLAGSADRASTIKRGDSLWIEVSERAVGPWVLYSDSLAVIRGRMTGPNGTGLAGIRLNARYTSALIGDGGFRGVTNWDGSFHMYAEPGIAHDISFPDSRRPGCTLFYNNGAATPKRIQSTPVRPFGEIPVELPIHVPGGACGWEIRGVAVDSEGQPLTGMTIETYTDNVTLRSASIADDGSFNILVPQNGSYHLRVRHDDGCRLFYHSDGAVYSPDDALPVRVVNAVAGNVRFVVPKRRCGWTIQGKVLDQDGAPVVAIGLTAFHPDGWRRTTSVAPDGSFSVRVPAEGPHRLGVRVRRPDTCSVYYRPDGATAEYDLAEAVEVGSDVTEIRIIVPDGVCGWRIAGRVVNHDGDAIGGRIHAVSDDRTQVVSRIEDDGSFSIARLTNGSWRLHVQIDSWCSMFYSVDGAVPRRDAASLVTIAGEHVTGIQFVMPNRTCDRWIKGRIVDAAGSARSDAEINVWTTRYSSYGHQPVEADGSFAVRVNEDGYYRINVSIGPFCTLYYAAGEWATTGEQEALWIPAQDRDEPGVVVRVPNNACGWVINGTVADSERRHLPEVRIIAVGPEGVTWSAVSGTDGSFSVLAPVAGSYQLRAEPREGCVFPLGTVEATEAENEVAGEQLSDARLITFDVELPADACVRQIRGRLVDADGQGVADEWLWAATSELERGGAFTEPDGSFTITVPVSGAYALSFWASDDYDCAIFYSGPAVASTSHATEIVVGDADVTDIVFWAPRNLCD